MKEAEAFGTRTELGGVNKSGVVAPVEVEGMTKQLPGIVPTLQVL